MANVDASFGLRPVVSPGGDSSFEMREYKVAAAYTTALFEGCLLSLTTDGTCILWIATGRAIGVAAQFRAGAATAANTTMLVYDDPNQHFVIQSDDGTLTDNGDVQGLAFGISADSGKTNAGGVTATGKSVMELDGASSQGAAETTNLLIGVRLARGIDQDNAAANNKVIVRIAAAAHVNGGVDEIDA